MLAPNVSSCFSTNACAQLTHLLGLMHACLNVDEIVRLIACELVASEANAAVVYFACCCKNFEGPLLDVLWETQDKLFPLLRPLPEDVRKADAL